MGRHCYMICFLSNSVLVGLIFGPKIELGNFKCNTIILPNLAQKLVRIIFESAVNDLLPITMTMSHQWRCRWTPNESIGIHEAATFYSHRCQLSIHVIRRRCNKITDKFPNIVIGTTSPSFWSEGCKNLLVDSQYGSLRDSCWHLMLK